jgi:hypothetical protein
VSGSSGTSSGPCSGRSATSRGSFAAKIVRRVAVLGALAFATTEGLACGGAKSTVEPLAGVEHTTTPAIAALAAKRVFDASRAPVVSHHVATVAKGALGPFVARSGGLGVAAWMAPAANAVGQEVIAVPIAPDGAPLSEPHVVAKVAQEATALVVRPSGGARGGWLVAWSAVLDRGESLTVLGLGQDGAARGDAVDVARTSDHIKWCDVVPTTQGAVGVWAEETRSGDANILATPIDGDGKPVGMPVRVARGVDRWQAVAFDDGVGLALVTTDAADAHPTAGRLSWLRLDAQAHPKAPAVSIGAKPSVSGDIDAVSLPQGVVLAWTDRTGEDAQVVLASVDAAGQVKGPNVAMDAVGGGSLVALAAGPRSAALAWEEPSARAHLRRSLHLATIATEGRLSAQSVTTLEIAPGPPSELVATTDGFALLAPAHACMGGTSSGSCAGPVAPTFVRFDARLQAVQTEPLFVTGATEMSAPFSFGWGLRCTGDRCFALAATSESPTPIFVVDLEPRASPFATPAAAPLPPDAPRVTSIETIATGPAFDDLAALRLGDATVVAALASAPFEGSERRSRGAAVTVRVLDDNGQPRGATQSLTSRAVPVGGVSIAPGGTPQEGAAVAWVTGSSRGENADRQVHVAHLDRAGRRNHEIELTTRAKGDVSGVAMAWAGDGWLVAWVDARDGNGEVYATKIDRDLTRVAREERITNAPGDAGDVALAVHGSIAWLAWSDPRESPREGLADIYATTLRTSDAKRAGDEVRVLASAPHSRSPQLAPTAEGDSAVLAWIEDAATGLEGPGAAMLALLDHDARVVRSPSILPLAGPGRPTSVVLAPSRYGVRAVVVRSGQDALAFEAVVVGSDGVATTKPWPLLDLEAPPSFEVALAFAGDALVFDDVGVVPGEHLVRRADIAWRR